MEGSLQNLHVVVTGATGELGAAVAALLMERGARCHLPVRSAARLDGTLQRASVVAGVDLTDERSVASFYRDLPQLWASIHCAGAFAAGPITETSLADLDQMLGVNARSAFLCSREAARALRATGRGGRIVNVVARQALEPRRGAGMVAYALSKSAVAALTVSLAEELASERILVNAVAPAVIDTPANRAAMPGADFSRWVTPAELAGTILGLVSPACSASGALLPVYGRS
jgi:NAD(P)-dependent dehydrogenase (short-subunit alcohol dehydrogenase family)